ncbi:hypothetical protein N752_01175 [Desulforamulus aquiferis]|nr:hypothetical protein [Desulforamulus aquiferis]RYD07227.1 hypothetical protein N752_01175 [Desulforamulus aquiferis]
MSFWSDCRGSGSEYSGIVVLGVIIAVGSLIYIAPKIMAVFEAIGKNIE